MKFHQMSVVVLSVSCRGALNDPSKPGGLSQWSTRSPGASDGARKATTSPRRSRTKNSCTTRPSRAHARGAQKTRFQKIRSGHKRNRVRAHLSRRPPAALPPACNAHSHVPLCPWRAARLPCTPYSTAVPRVTPTPVRLLLPYVPSTPPCRPPLPVLRPRPGRRLLTALRNSSTPPCYRRRYPLNVGAVVKRLRRRCRHHLAPRVLRRLSIPFTSGLSSPAVVDGLPTSCVCSTSLTRRRMRSSARSESGLRLRTARLPGLHPRQASSGGATMGVRSMIESTKTTMWRRALRVQRCTELPCLTACAGTRQAS